MEQREKIMEFQNVNIVEYLNKIHKTPDNFLIETQKSNLKKYMKELNVELYKSFVNNSNDLLDILNTYYYCYELLTQFNIPRVQHEEEIKTNVNALKCKELSKKIERFEDDLSPYCTEKRYLVTSEYFNDKKYYVLLTNDLFIIGESIKQKQSRENLPINEEHPGQNKRPGTKKYKLLHAFSKRVISLVLKEGYITLDAQTKKFTLTNDQDTLVDFYDLFNDITYCEDTENKDDQIDQKLIEYFIITEQIEKLAQYVKKFKNVQLDTSHIPILSVEHLKMVLKISSNPDKTFTDYITKTFERGLENINKIQQLKYLINDSFDYLSVFVKDMKELSDIGVDTWVFNIAIEIFIQTIFKFIEKRIFNKFYELKITNDNLKLIESKLIFDQYDYHYMFNSLLKRKEGFSMRCVEIAKNEIDDLLDHFLD